MVNRAELQETVRVFRETGSKTETARALGVARSTVIGRIKRATELGIDVSPESEVMRAEGGCPAKKQHTATETRDGLVIFSVSDTDRTVDDVIKRGGYDLAIWHATKSVANHYEVPMKLKTEGNDQPAVVIMWQIKVWMQRRDPKWITDAIHDIHERAKEYSPTFPPQPKFKKQDDPHALILGLYDVHFGKLAWGEETGNQYDLKIAATVFRDAVEDLMGYVQSFNIEEVVIPVGQDFVHIDTIHGTTTSGTQLDYDSRYGKIVSVAFDSLVNAIEYVQQRVKKVTCYYVPGNHDRTVSYHLSRELAAWYRKTDDVTIDTTFRKRKSYVYGKNLVGFAHGDTERPAKLAGVLAIEWPHEWANSTCREWLIGHKHRRKTVERISVDTHDGVTVRELPSLSGTDAWHYENLYLSNRSAEAYLYSRDRGYAGHFAVNPRQKGR